MLVMVFLQFSEPPSAVFGGIDMMQGVVANIVGHVAEEEEGPKRC